MQLVDRGHGVPLVVVPGIQGRWEYLAPAVDALARAFRVIAFSLYGDRTSRRRRGAAGLDGLAGQVIAALDRAGVDRAIVCGISFGGLVALRAAARHPERIAALTLVSTPGPGFRLSPRHRLYAKLPWVFGPLFLAETPLRLRRELTVAFPRLSDRVRFGWRQARTLVTAPLSLAGMASLAGLIGEGATRDDCTRVQVPTLVVTGEPSLDRVVRVESTREYVSLIRGARGAELRGTGHVGYLSRPEAFASLIREFADSVIRKHDAA